MSTPPGKPVDLGAYKSRERSEPSPSETQPQPFRSPYAPKPPHERAAREPHAVASGHDPARSPYAPKTARAPLSGQSGVAAGAAPELRPAGHAPDEPRGAAPMERGATPAAERHAFSVADRRAVEIDGPDLCPDDGPSAGRVPAPPLFGEREPPDHPPAAAFEARAGEHAAAPEAPLQPADTGGSRRHERPAPRSADEIMSEVDLERLEASLRWLQ